MPFSIKGYGSSVKPNRVTAGRSDAAKPGVLEPTLKHGRLHSCRHYFCSNRAENGIHRRTVMLWLGRRDSDMVRHDFDLKDETSHRLITKPNSPLPPAE